VNISKTLGNVKLIFSIPYNFSYFTTTYLKLCTTIYHLNKLLTPWSRVLHEKPAVTQLVKKFPATFHGIRRFITVLTRSLTNMVINAGCGREGLLQKQQ